MRSNLHELAGFVALTDQLGAQLQLLHVEGDRGGEDVFVRDDRHHELDEQLARSLELASPQAREQLLRIGGVLDAHRQGPPRWSEPS